MGEELNNDDIDALLAGGGAAADSGDAAEPAAAEEKTTVSNDDIDALLAGGAATADSGDAAEPAEAPAAEEKTTISNDEIDALLAGGVSVGDDAPAATTDSAAINNDDMAALIDSVDGVTESAAEAVDERIIDLVETATTVGCAAWQTLLNREVKQDRTISEMGNPAASLEGSDLVGACIPVSGDAQGSLYLTYSKAAASRVIGSMLMESDEDIAARAEKEFDDEDKDAFGEAINQWGGAVSQAWRDALGCDLSFGPCELAHGASFMQLLLPGAGSAIFHFDVTVEGGETTPAWICVDTSLVSAWAPAAAAVAESAAEAAPTAQGGGEPDEMSDILGENINAVLSIDVPIRVIIAQKEMTMAAARDISTGSIIEFDKNCEEVLDVYIGNQIMGRGEVIIRRERFGVQVKDVLSLEQRIRMLGT